jgi:hypothetical protein
MDKRQAQRESFVVRIWREPGQPEWRGWVQHVGSGHSTALQSLDELMPFIECWLARSAKQGKRGLK